MRAVDTIQSALSAATDPAHGRRLGRQIAPLRGLRGVPGAAITRILVESWKDGQCTLPDDSAALQRLFSTAFEDGLVAIGLATATLPDDPAPVQELAERWLEMVDDIQTADAIGWMMLGPALLAQRIDLPEALAAHRSGPPAVRRAAAIAGMAALPVPLEGPSAAALRERVGQRRIAFANHALDRAVGPHLALWMRDEDPHVRRVCGRMLREWAAVSPDAAAETAEAHKGGLPRFLRENLEKGLRKARRRSRQAPASEE